MEARTDFERYPNAAKMCRNFILFPQGGITRRPGSRFIKEVKDSTALTRLLPMEFSELDAYAIEAGDGYMRVYRRQGQVTVETTNAAITNGTFTSNITGWTDESTGSATIAHDATNGRLQLNGNADGKAVAEQAVTISSSYQAVEHVLKFQIAGYAGTVGLRVGSTSGGSEILSETLLTSGYHAIGFTPGVTTFYIQFTNKNVPARAMYVDGVSFAAAGPFEIQSPYSTSDLTSLRPFQAADVVYLLHGTKAPRRLERRGHRSWSVAEAVFTDGPYLEINGGTDVDEKQLITNGLFDNGLTNWNNHSTNDGFMVYNEAGKFAELDPGGDSSATFTVTIASPGVFTLNNHGLVANQKVKLSTNGALPTGLVAGQVYYVVSASITANTFQLSATSGGAAINTSGSQSGTHTLTTVRGVAIMRSDVAATVSGHKHVAHILVLAAGPVTVKIGKTAGGTEYVSASQQPGWMSYDFTSSGADLYVQFEFSEPDVGRAGIGGCQIFNENARLLYASGTTGSVTVTAKGFADGAFTASDVGRFLRLVWPGHDSGYGIITGYTDANTVTMLVLRKLASTASSEEWRFGAWGGDQGYPNVISFFDGRSVFANTTAKANTMWFSQSDRPQDMRPDSFTDGDLKVEDDDAITATLQSTKINPIYWVAGQKQLMVGTAGGQWIIKSAGAVITPADISAKQHSAVACAELSAIEINQTIIFADRARRKVHELSFSLEQDSFLATDMNILADHALRSRVEEMAYQRNPLSLVWCRRADGRLALLAYNKQHEVLGWTQSIFGGAFGSGGAVCESIITIPGSDDSDQVYTSDERNEVWVIVKRTINGQTKRYIEVIEGFFDGPLREDYDTEEEWAAAMQTQQADGFFVDSGLTYEGAPTSVFTNLDHLEGQTVKVLADGKPLPDRIVTGGSISINGTASKIHAGLSYKHRYEGLKLAPDMASGTSVNKTKIITDVGVILLDSATFKCASVVYDDDSGRRQHQLHTVSLRKESQPENEAVPLFTGETQLGVEGSYTPDSRIYIEGDAPLPFTLLALAPQMELRPK